MVEGGCGGRFPFLLGGTASLGGVCCFSSPPPSNGVVFPLCWVVLLGLRCSFPSPSRWWSTAKVPENKTIDHMLLTAWKVKGEGGGRFRRRIIVIDFGEVNGASARKLNNSSHVIDFLKGQRGRGARPREAQKKARK